jgi:hypothetical protein
MVAVHARAPQQFTDRMDLSSRVEAYRMMVVGLLGVSLIHVRATLKSHLVTFVLHIKVFCVLCAWRLRRSLQNADGLDGLR